VSPLLLVLAQCHAYLEVGVLDAGTVSASSLYVAETARAAAFVAPYVAASVWLEGPVFTPGTDGQGATVLGMRASNAPGADFTVTNFHQRDAGSIEEWKNHQDATGDDKVVAHVEPAGTLVGAIGATDESIPAFRVGSGISGAAGLTAAEGLYLSLEGRLPSGYRGDHGAITLRNLHPMDTGTLVEVSNNLHGTTTDKVFNVDHEGGIFALHGLCEWLFDECPGVPRGGTLQYDFCDERWKQCTSDGWIPVQLVGD